MYDAIPWMEACVCVCVYVCVCMCVCMYVCMYVCIYLCIYVCMHACMYVCTYTYKVQDINTYTYTYKTKKKQRSTELHCNWGMSRWLRWMSSKNTASHGTLVVWHWLAFPTERTSHATYTHRQCQSHVHLEKMTAWTNIWNALPRQRPASPVSYKHVNIIYNYIHVLCVWCIRTIITICCIICCGLCAVVLCPLHPLCSMASPAWPHGTCWSWSSTWKMRLSCIP